ncbi:MAG: hypothetical protein EON95_05550 [Caulobacteraceae bacterium]|nr:MAG: hypothetical protein EON95_05550 [Caulobacteraceae bacterium]
MIVALGAAMLLASAAVGIDLGSIYLESRKLQGVADLAALAAANDIGRAQTAAEATVAANGLGGATRVELELGTYTPDAAIPAAQRFKVGGASPSAARVRLHSQARLAFGAFVMGKPTVAISRVGATAQTQLASFSIGSRLASLNGGVANALLTGLTGSQVNLSVMDYQALAAADVDLLRYVPALATRLNLKAATFDQVLDTEVSAPMALNALADVLTAQGATREAGSIKVLANASASVPNLKMSHLLDLGVYGDQDRAAGGSRATISLSSLDLARALLLTGQEGRQVALDLSAGVPGLLKADATLAIGERPNNSPWLSVTADKGVILRTAQTRLFIELDTSPVGAAGLGFAQVRLPVLLQLAEGRARLDSINCATGQVGIAASPGIGRLVIGEIEKGRLGNFKSELTVSPARFVAVPLLSVTGQADTRVGGDAWRTLTFSQGDIDGRVIRTASTRDTAQTSLSSLLGNTELTVNLLGIGLTPLKSGIVSSVNQTLGSLAGPLDGTLNGLTDLLGVGLGELDVRVNGLRCRDAALVA